MACRGHTGKYFEDLQDFWADEPGKFRQNCKEKRIAKTNKKAVDKLGGIWYSIKAVAWETASQQQKRNKKVVDKYETLWYNIKAVAWNGNNKKEHW